MIYSPQSHSITSSAPITAGSEQKFLTMKFSLSKSYFFDSEFSSSIVRCAIKRNVEEGTNDLIETTTGKKTAKRRQPLRECAREKTLRPLEKSIRHYKSGRKDDSFEIATRLKVRLAIDASYFSFKLNRQVGQFAVYRSDTSK